METIKHQFELNIYIYILAVDTIQYNIYLKVEQNIHYYTIIQYIYIYRERERIMTHVYII